jgi:hypothetical protein
MPHTTNGQPFAAGSQTSFEAALRASSFVSKQGLEVYRWLRDRGSYGGTMAEAEAALSIKRQSLCARFRALEQTGAIRKAEKKRSGCGVYEIATGETSAQMGLW